MEAIVLAGGLGTRLRGVVSDVPKPMAPVQGRPFLSFVLDRLVDAGFERAVLATGYLHDALRAFFGAEYRGMPVDYSVETEPLGTGGAVRLAWDGSEADQPFVLNGDTFLELDFASMFTAHLATGAILTLAVRHVADAARYGALELSGDRVRAFAEKGKSGPGWINAGAYILTSHLRPLLPARASFSLEHDVLAPCVEAIRPLAFRCNGRFIDIGTPEDYREAERLLQAQ
jgi:D-glycero-alpha-D-manno-heptose 1-phosphate guanylyltransferase